MKKHVNFSEYVSVINIPYEDRKGEWVQMGVDRCRFKRRIANVSDIITSVLLKKIEKAHLWFDGYMYKHASSTTTYSYKTGRHTSDLCYSINGINQWKHADKIGNDVSKYILCDDTFTFICKSISRETRWSLSVNWISTIYATQKCTNWKMVKKSWSKRVGKGRRYWVSNEEGNKFEVGHI